MNQITDRVDFYNGDMTYELNVEYNQNSPTIEATIEKI